jgi:hypothetical protein
VLDAESRPLVELHFRPTQLAEMQSLAEAARELGFEATEAKKLALSENLAAEAATWGVLIIVGGATLIDNVAKVLEVPANVRKIREKLRPFFSRAHDISPVLQLEPVHRWLNSKYGERWRYDPQKISGKTIVNVTVFLVEEQISGNRHLLAVEGDTVEELPESWLRDE